METTNKITLFLDKRELGILQPDSSYKKQNHSDWYINVNLIKTIKLVDDYVHTYMDPFRTSITRQLVNPYFIEYGFFETISSYSGNVVDVTVNLSEMPNIDFKAKLYGIDINK